MVEIMSEVGTVLASMSENWQGVAVLLIVCMVSLIGPLCYVLIKMMELQAKEGEANRQIIREIAQLQRESSGEVANAVHKVELAVTSLLTKWG